MERIVARIAMLSAKPRDLLRLRDALHVIPQLRDSMSPLDSPLLNQLLSDTPAMPELADLLQRAISDECAATIRDGGVLNDNYNQELGELRRLSKESGEELLKLEKREKERTGINTLRIKYNRVHGYAIELPRSRSEQPPESYIRRQTLKNSERFITEELKEFEDRILGAKERALALEKKLFSDLLDLLHARSRPLMTAARALSEIDVLANYAERASTLALCCPQLSNKNEIEIIGGRHPVVEAALDGPFIANDINLDAKSRMLLITGPNMGGKSTYMRQCAVITLLAHTGAYVPADSAKIGVVDRLFTRIGAADDLAGGRSTFMVEMTEMAHILRNATRNSLVLVDEIGRGTSTFDGLALAWACASDLAVRVKAVTLFSTHYFELTALADKLNGVTNVHLDAIEHGADIVFLYSVKKGPASQSYGLQVARLAGVPDNVIQEARHKLHLLEDQYVGRNSDQLEPVAAAQTSLFAETPPENQAVIAKIKSRDVNELTPREALNVLFELSELLEKS